MSEYAPLQRKSTVTESQSNFVPPARGFGTQTGVEVPVPQSQKLPIVKSPTAAPEGEKPTHIQDGQAPFRGHDFSKIPILPKSMVSTPDDPAQEADRVGESVIQPSEPSNLAEQVSAPQFRGHQLSRISISKEQVESRSLGGFQTIPNTMSQTGLLNRKLDDDSQTEKSAESVTSLKTDQFKSGTDSANITTTEPAPASQKSTSDAVPTEETNVNGNKIDQSSFFNQSDRGAATNELTTLDSSVSSPPVPSSPALNAPVPDTPVSNDSIANAPAKQSELAVLQQPVPAANATINKISEPLSENTAEARVQQDLVKTPQPLLPSSSDLALAAQQIIQRAEAEKTALSQTAEAQYTVVIEQAETTVETIEAATESKIQAILSDLEGKKAGVIQTISTTKAAVKEQFANQMVVVQAEGIKALDALRQGVESKRKVALNASENEAKHVDQTGQTEAQRIMTSSSESSERINSTADQKANGSSPKPEVQSIVRHTVGQTASEVVGKMQQRSWDVSKNAKESTQKVAQGLRDAGQQLAFGIGNNTTQVEKSIQDGTNATVSQMTTQEAQYQQKLDALQVQSLIALDNLKSHSIAVVQQSGQSTAAVARQAGQIAATEITQAKAASLQQLDKGVYQVVSQLNQVPTEQQIDNLEMEKLVEEVGGKLQQANVQLGNMISERTNSFQTNLNQVSNTFQSHLEETQQKISTEANQVTSSLDNNLTQVPVQVNQSAQQAITENKNANQQAIQQFDEGLQQQIDKAKQGWSQEKEKINSEVRGKIEEGIQSNQDVASKAPADFAQLANTTAAKAEESLVSQIFGGIWEGIKKVASGLAILVAVVLVITAVVLVAAAIAGIAVVASEVFLTVAAIVGIGFLLYGFITAMIKRSDDFWKTYGTNIPWYQQVLGFFAVFGVAIGDAVGITPIIEGSVGKEAFTGKEFTPEQRAEKITEGVLTLALMFIMGRLLKGSKAGEVPGGEVKPSEVKPGEVKPGETKPGEPKPDEPIPLEPGVRAKRTTVDGHHEIKVTDRGIIRCSPTCGAVEQAYPNELKQRPDLKERLDRAKEIEKANPEAVAEEVKNIDSELAALRRTNLTEAKAEAHSSIEAAKKLLDNKETSEKLSGEGKGSFDNQRRTLDKDLGDSKKSADEAKGDPDLEGLALEEFKQINERAKKLESDIQEKIDALSQVVNLPSSWGEVRPDVEFQTSDGRKVSFSKEQIRLGEQFDALGKHLKAIDKGQVAPKGNNGLVPSPEPGFDLKSKVLGIGGDHRFHGRLQNGVLHFPGKITDH
jgi:hypothetical protein